MDNFMIAILVILASSFIGRRINQKASEKLNDDQKARLVTLFSRSGIYSFIILILILGLFFSNIKFKWVDQGSASLVFMVFITTFLLGNAYRTYKKLKEANFPESYVKQNLLSNAVRFLGLILFFVILNWF
ncbi:hypothetical protein FEE95_13500 [Maribacter algarum]|uniref:Uncharacterized protein n=1 Tax=Maribacter algarum (ex Zhang et al. 2020) TaxID=2578118 RepID=A0A5S3PS02_9FLAO|nr:hypothetical protein [Maribacter algarum]TMM57492.1 hypothetical protein FEE95_13500 [Maribacter algarum]